MNPKLSKNLGLFSFIILFLLAVYFANKYPNLIHQYLDIGAWGVFYYFLIEIASVVFAPLTTIAILPIAVVLWGPFWAAVFSIISWFFGSVIVFWICKKFGKQFIERFISLEAVKNYENKLDDNQKFIQLILLRMVTPVDILSYALGLFTNVSWRMYLITTAIGIAPFAFLFAYFSGASPMLRIFYGLIIVILIILVILIIKKSNKK